MKKTTFTLLLSLSCCWLAAQCPAGDITFSTQGQIDSFQINYPGCSDIPGSVTISGNDITNLQGLNALDSIYQCCFIENNPILTSLQGLENLTYIGGGCLKPFGPGGSTLHSFCLSITNNTSLASLKGLDGLKSIGQCLSIAYNPALTDLNGLDSLTKVGSCTFQNSEFDGPRLSLEIVYNKSLKTLAGLSGVDSLTILIISSNDSLSSLNGLYGLRSIGWYLSVSYNASLTSLNGLDSLTSIGGGLEIQGNAPLTSLSGLDNLTSIGGILLVDYNYSLISLNGLDNLTSIGGHLWVNSPALTSLSGLDNLTSIGGDLNVGGAFTSLSGLDNLTSIGGDLELKGNAPLTSLSGLDNLTSIGGDLWVNSPALTSLNGLDSLTSIGGGVYVTGNAALTSLSGLDNIDPATITQMSIQYNPQLFLCDVQSVCDYLVENGGPATVSNNAPGCNSVPEVEAACIVSIDETPNGEPVLLFSPNPASDFLQIQVNDNEKWEISLFDLRGRQMFRKVVSGSQMLGLEDWPSGIYALRAASGERVFAGKIVKQ